MGKFSVFGMNFSIYLNRRVFIMNDSFLISLRKHLLWYSLEVPCQGASNEFMLSWRK